MKIAVEKLSNDTFTLRFGDTEVGLSRHDIKTLLVKVMEAIHPGGAPGRSPDEPAAEVSRRVMTLSDVQVQSLLRTVDEADVLVLLKVSENNRPLLGRLYGNMSERWRAMYQEDLRGKFEDEPLSDGMASETLHRILEVLGGLEG